MNFSDATSLMYAANMTLAEKGIASAKVILTGFVVVFSVLLLLIAVIKIYSTIVQKALDAGKKKKTKEKIESNSTSPAPVVTSTPAPVVQDGISEEVVAVISAAVATMYGSSEKPKIKSIKKSGTGRSAWANAGVLENTRPF